MVGIPLLAATITHSGEANVLYGREELDLQPFLDIQLCQTRGGLQTSKFTHIETLLSRSATGTSLCYARFGTCITSGPLVQAVYIIIQKNCKIQILHKKTQYKLP